MKTKVIPAKLALSIKDENLAEKYAQELNKFGFEIIKITPRGVSFRGAIHLFEKVFKSEVETKDDEHKFITLLILPKEIKDSVDSIYFPTKPIFFK